MTAATKPSTALAPRDQILGMVQQYSEQIAQLAPEGMTPEHFIASLRLYMAKTPDLLKCNPVSVAMGVLQVAQTGLTLGVSCDLLVFGGACQFSPRYGGIIELALAAGTNAIDADVVREGDHFSFEKGTNSYLKHTRAFQKDAPITHAYAVAALRYGKCVFTVWTREEIDAHRARFSKQWSVQKVPSLDAIPWYAKKTMVRQLSPFLPKNARLAAALMFADAPEPEPEAGDTAGVQTPTKFDEETGEILRQTEAPEAL
jgi:recombination protein RecT